MMAFTHLMNLGMKGSNHKHRLVIRSSACFHPGTPSACGKSQGESSSTTTLLPRCLKKLLRTETGIPTINLSTPMSVTMPRIDLQNVWSCAGPTIKKHCQSNAKHLCTAEVLPRVSETQGISRRVRVPLW